MTIKIPYIVVLLIVGGIMMFLLGLAEEAVEDLLDGRHSRHIQFVSGYIAGCIYCGLSSIYKAHKNGTK